MVLLGFYSAVLLTANKIKICVCYTGQMNRRFIKIPTHFPHEGWGRRACDSSQGSPRTPGRASWSRASPSTSLVSGMRRSSRWRRMWPLRSYPKCLWILWPTCNNPRYRPFAAASWVRAQIRYRYHGGRESVLRLRNHIFQLPRTNNSFSNAATLSS